MKVINTVVKSHSISITLNFKNVTRILLYYLVVIEFYTIKQNYETCDKLLILFNTVGKNKNHSISSTLNFKNVKRILLY